MERENDEIKTILREAVHLSAEEISDYLDGWMDPDSANSVVQHLDACRYCSEEVELIRQTLEKEPSQGIVETVVAAAGNVVEMFSRKKRQFNKLWLGERQYALEQLPEFPNFREIKALTTKQLVAALRDDRKDRGSVPVAVEAPGEPPVLAVLAAFEPSGPYHQIVKQFSEDHDRGLEEELDALEQARESVPRMAAFGFVAAVSRKPAKLVPHARMILKYRTKRDTIEIFMAIDQDKLFLRISPRRPSKAK